MRYYCGTEGTSKNLYNFLKIISITVDSTILTVDLMLVQSSIRRLNNRRLNTCSMVDSMPCTTVKSTLVQSSNQRLCNRRINTSTTVDSTGLQLLIRRLKNRRINACATVESTLVQTSLHLYNCRFDPCKKSLFCFILVRNIANINTNLF